ncbi:hypothetical protein AVEN_59960-1 [Araneus ventricosus]|uniref:Uncharacterized protein n=1 Tax=Araneus ventricosus TaxID=182803 RepID=A0A4Y2RTZ0_ARAVE|nr:hypothetical protein AVEN_59960-1 [Araneus ventricosus]
MTESILANRRVTVYEISNQLDISHGSMPSVLPPRDEPQTPDMPVAVVLETGYSTAFWGGAVAITDESPLIHTYCNIRHVQCRWPSGNVSASGTEICKFQSCSYRTPAVYVVLLHFKSYVGGQAPSRWCGARAWRKSTSSGIVHVT